MIGGRSRTFLCARKLALPLSLSLLAIALCAAGAAAQTKSVKIMLDWIIQGTHAPYFVAQEKGYYRAAGVTVDAIDVTFGFVGLAVLVQGLPRSPRTAIPHVGLWVVLATFLALSYAASPSGEANMTDPVRGAYQIYRYGLRMALMYPLACLLIDTPEKLDDVILCVVAAGIVFAWMGIVQGYGGLEAVGPFKTKNGLGAALAVFGGVVFLSLTTPVAAIFALALAPIAFVLASGGAWFGIAR